MTIKSELEIRRELKHVRAMLAKYRKHGIDDTDMLYGAQQAIGWVLGDLGAPTALEARIQAIADSGEGKVTR